MTTNYIASVPKLKGRENYDEWCFAAENLLVLEGMEKYIKPSADFEVKPVDDSKTKAKLILTIDPALYVHIRNTRSSAELWTKLKAMFDDSGFSRKITLLRHLISIRLENCDSMTTYVTQMIETAQRLNGTGFTITDEWVGSLLLAGLTDRYSPMIMAIEHSGISISADTIKSKLLDMEVTSDFEGAAGGTAAFAARNKYNSGSSGKPKKYGGNPMSNKKTAADTPAKTITCFKCKEDGHYRNQCPMLKKNTNKCVFNVVFLNGKYNKNEWYVDSGASAHITANKDWVKNMNTTPCIPEIVVANESKVPVVCSGEVDIISELGCNITVKDVLCVPSLTTNLLSVSELIQNGNHVIFTKKNCYIRDKNNVLVATADLSDGVYKLRLQSQSCMLATTASAKLWHRRLAHINSQDMHRMRNGIVDGLSYDNSLDITKSQCTTCCEGKQMRLPFSHVGERSTETLHRIHTDICGPMETSSLSGARYFLLFVDDYSRMTFIYFLKQKNEALNRFKEFKSLVENQQSKKIKVIRSDNGLEFCNKEFEGYLKQAGIIHQKTNCYTPEQNGLCERSNRTVVEKAKCLLYDANLDKKFWAEAANTAVYLKNRSIASGLDKTPYELWYGSKPDLSHLRLFGSKIMVHVPKQKRLKWDKKATQHILVGYGDGVKGYRVYNPSKNTVMISRDIIVMEDVTPIKEVSEESATWISNEENPTDNLVEESKDKVGESRDSVGDLSNNVSETDFLDCSSGSSLHTDDNETLTEINTEDVPEQAVSIPEQVPDVPSKRQRKKPERYGISNICVSSTVPASEEIVFSEALEGPDREQWKQAMADELQSFEDSDAWQLVDHPGDVTIVKCRWVLNKKYDFENNVRYRARLVAKGFSQKPGVDYTDTFSPVVRHSTLRLLFALSVQMKMSITHLDVTTAFLNGFLKENIYMSLPEGFVNKSGGKVLKLNKAIYGLKQSSLAWYERVKEVLSRLDFKNSQYEPCLFTKITGKIKVIVALYVDDFLIFSNNDFETNKLKSVLGSEFKLKDLGPVRQYLGMRINLDKNKNVITVDQQQYIEQLVSKFQMSDCKTQSTPIEPKLNLDKSSDKCLPDVPYQKLIGSLMYLAVLTRPDIAYCVSYLSQFNSCYSHIHWNYCKRVLRYLLHTKSYCLKYTNNNNSNLQGFVDSDWASDALDRKSYTGFCFMLSGSAISWQSRKQKTVSLSSTEAEYTALSEASREAIYLRNLMHEITDVFNVIDLYCDNQSALKLASSSQSHNRSKHIDVRCHFIRDVVKNKFVKVKYIPTEEMPADILTKGLCHLKHYKFMNLLGIVSV